MIVDRRQSVAVPSTVREELRLPGHVQSQGAASTQRFESGVADLNDSRILRGCQEEQVIKGAVKSPTKIIEAISKAELYQSLDDKSMEQCPNCLRTFLMGRLHLHLRNCTKLHPMKKLNTKNFQKYTLEYKNQNRPVKSSLAQEDSKDSTLLEDSQAKERLSPSNGTFQQIFKENDRKAQPTTTPSDEYRTFQDHSFKEESIENEA